MRNAFPDLVAAGDPSWEEIEAALPDAIADIDIRMINGTAKDALDYAERKETGLKVIAIGGDKLSRGLTLEGLCVSYFLRASKMYDTLMQMGRWFGYRPGYLDLCRLYTTSDLHEWFEHITEAGGRAEGGVRRNGGERRDAARIRTEGPVSLRPDGHVQAENEIGAKSDAVIQRTVDGDRVSISGS